MGSNSWRNVGGAFRLFKTTRSFLATREWIVPAMSWRTTHAGLGEIPSMSGIKFSLSDILFIMPILPYSSFSLTQLKVTLLVIVSISSGKYGRRGETWSPAWRGRTPVRRASRAGPWTTAVQRDRGSPAERLGPKRRRICHRYGPLSSPLHILTLGLSRMQGYQ